MNGNAFEFRTSNSKGGRLDLRHECAARCDDNWVEHSEA